MKREYQSNFFQQEFEVIAMDEVQNLKNIRSIGSLAIRNLKANFKVCLTGTPVENDISEFFNILDLCVPGLWGDILKAKKNKFLEIKALCVRVRNHLSLEEQKIKFSEISPTRWNKIKY